MEPLRNRRDYNERTAGGISFGPLIDRLLEELSSFRYGCVYTDGSCETDMAVIDERDGRDIHVQSPLEFWERRTGMCHDASVLVDAFLGKEGIPHVCTWFSSDRPPHFPTHSFVVARTGAGTGGTGLFKNGSGCAIIDVFSARCVYAETFIDYAEAIAWRLSKWIGEDNGGDPDVGVFAGPRMPRPKCGFMEFSRRIADSFRKIR